MLVTVTEIKNYLNITGSGLDTFLTTVSQEAQNILESWMNRSFEEQTDIEEDFSGDDSDIRVLKHRPVTAVSEVLISIDNNSEITSTGYKFFEESGILQLKANIFPKGVKNCRVTYTAGYTASTIPAAIKLAIKQLAALIYKESGQGEGRLGKRSINQPDGGTVSYIDKLPSQTLRMLSRYRDIRFT